MNRGRRFRFESPDDHIVVIDERGRRLLLDTGSPRTFGDVHPDWLGVESPIRGSGPDFDFEAVSRFVGARIDGLVGTDVLGQVPFLVDWKNHVVEFDPLSPPDGAAEVPVDFSTRVPVVEFTVAGRRVRGPVDTGAVISFFSVEPASLPDPIGHRREFVPGRLDETGTVVLERFDTKLWPLPVEFGGRPFIETFGKLPGEDEPSPQADEFWILGAGLWKSYRVLFDLPQRRILVGGPTRA